MTGFFKSDSLYKFQAVWTCDRHCSSFSNVKNLMITGLSKFLFHHHHRYQLDMYDFSRSGRCKLCTGDQGPSLKSERTCPLLHAIGEICTLQPLLLMILRSPARKSDRPTSLQLHQLQQSSRISQAHLAHATPIQSSKYHFPAPSA